MLTLSRAPMEWVKITVPPSSEPREIKVVMLHTCKRSGDWGAAIGFDADDDIRFVRNELLGEPDWDPATLTRSSK